MTRRTTPRLTFVAAVTAFLMAFGGVALADNINDSIADGGAGVTLVAGDASPTNNTATVKVVGNGGGEPGCDIDAGESLTISFNTPTGVTATPASVEFNACAVDHTVAFKASATAVSGNVTASITDNTTGTASSTFNNNVSIPITVTSSSDTTVPDTSITANPTNPSNSSSASFSFTGTDNVTSAANLTFECSLDGSTFAACTSPESYSGLTDGSHTFQVRAKDQANNVDPTPASYTWTISTCTAPSVTTDPANDTVTYGDNASFTAAASGTPSPTVQWQVDTGSGFTNINGATSTTLTLTKPAVADSGNQYRAVFSNSCGSDTSDAATLTVNRATVNVTASSHNDVTYGDAAPTITPQYSGFITGESSSVLTTSPTCGTTYTQGSGVSGSPYSSSCSGAAAANYTFTYTAGSVSVARASLTVTASSPTVTYGDAVPTITPQYSGFVLSENASALTTAPNCGTTYTQGSAVDGGPYTTSCSGAAADNYSISYQGGSVTVNKKALTVTADDKSIYFGESEPTFTFAYSNDFVGSDSASDIDTAPTCGVSGAHTAVGQYSIVCSGGSDNNYSFDYDNGTFTVRAWTLNGFYQPVDMGATVWNTVKGGSTVPLKFEVFAGATELTDVAAVDRFVATPATCPNGSVTTDAIEVTTTGGTNLRYDTTGGQFIQNWQTPKKPGACYKVTMFTDDDSAISANFMLK